MPRIGPLELVLILAIVLIIFGAAKLPQIGGALGKSIREFRKASRGEDEEVRPSTTAQSSTTPPPSTTNNSTKTETKQS
jgi:sec-independent protein translocase protein TatA